MPRIFDNIEQSLLPVLKDTLKVSNCADFCVGYFNLRGWKLLGELIDSWQGNENCCRLLVGMQSAPKEDLKKAFRLTGNDNLIDNATVIRLKKRIAEDFREQLTYGTPTNVDEKALQRLREQLKKRKVIVKLFLRHQLHAKLYLLHREDANNPTIGFIGSSNLTFSGLSGQGELNIDVLDHDACKKLKSWFDDRWKDSWCLDITDELAEIIDTSWARQKAVPPYQIYLKIAYHLSQEARAGLSEFHIPREFGNRLFEFQTAAVKIAAHHLKKRGGVLLGDVVGLGKTMMASALAKLNEEQTGSWTLIICPKNLTKMWQSYVDEYALNAKVMSMSQVLKKLSDVPARYRTVLIDESHNLRNTEGKRYRAIQEFIRQTDARCILLSATPYNKTYLDLSAQLQLFIPNDKDLGVRPEQKIREKGEAVFQSEYQCAPRSLAAFEKSEYADDWRDLMRHFLVRRTRSFIQKNYAEEDEGGRKFLRYENGELSYFPTRTPKTVKFAVNDSDPNDQYARLTQPSVVQTIERLKLPRYGLGNYVVSALPLAPSEQERKVLDGLSRAGLRLMGFCRTNLFKRLESGGTAFLLSIERHILRNFVYLHALENNLPIPIGTQAAEVLDTNQTDTDDDLAMADLFDSEDEAVDTEETLVENDKALYYTNAEFEKRAAEIYGLYQTKLKKRFKWIRTDFFRRGLKKNLREDCNALISILQENGVWKVEKDEKLKELLNLLQNKHKDEKVLVFTQFADTVNYLANVLKTFGVEKLAGVTGSSDDPTALAWRFSPISNDKQDKIKPDDELRVLVATDVLSEGQNLQDAHIVVNYDLPWAIVRLIQRAGRVDRIGQKAEEIIAYSFLPADGIERIINLRARVYQRLQENAEVVGSDETFFEDQLNNKPLFDLYHEKAGIMDEEADTEVDLASYAYQIWKNAIDADKTLAKRIPDLPKVSYSTRLFTPTSGMPEGVLVYVRTAEGTDSLAWIDKNGASVTESQLAILQAAACHPDTTAIERNVQHHKLVGKGVEHLIQEERTLGGQLGRKSGARYRVYERLKSYAEEIKGTLFESKTLNKVIDEIYRFPLKSSAVELLNRRLREKISDYNLVELVTALREDDSLCITEEMNENTNEPQLICSLGLFSEEKQ